MRITGGGKTHPNLICGVFGFRKRRQIILPEIRTGDRFGIFLKFPVDQPAENKHFADSVSIWRRIVAVAVLNRNQTERGNRKSSLLTHFLLRVGTDRLQNIHPAAGQ